MTVCRYRCWSELGLEREIILTVVNGIQKVSVEASKAFLTLRSSRGRTCRGRSCRDESKGKSKGSAPSHSERYGGARVGVKMRCNKYCKHGSLGHNSYDVNNIANQPFVPTLRSSTLT